MVFLKTLSENLRFSTDIGTRLRKDSTSDCTVNHVTAALDLTNKIVLRDFYDCKTKLSMSFQSISYKSNDIKGLKLNLPKDLVKRRNSCLFFMYVLHFSSRL